VIRVNIPHGRDQHLLQIADHVSPGDFEFLSDHGPLDALQFIDPDRELTPPP